MQNPYYDHRNFDSVTRRNVNPKVRCICHAQTRFGMTLYSLRAFVSLLVYLFGIISLGIYSKVVCLP
jgi:hypothetical protein